MDGTGGLNVDQVEHVASAIRRADSAGELGPRDLGLMDWGRKVAVVALRAMYESALLAGTGDDGVRGALRP